MNANERNLLATKPIVWTGDLADDCTAKWAGLMLRAEWMDKDYWWWAVYDMQRNEATIDNSNEYEEMFIGGEAARKKAESVAKKYMENITERCIAKYFIADTFKITGRGLVFGGHIIEGQVSTRDIIQFTAFEWVIHKTIIGIDWGVRSHDSKMNTGFLVKCENEHEIDELRKWRPNNEVAFIFKPETLL